MQKGEKDGNPTLISVIIPVYNVGEYLAACVDSVLAQSHRDLEIILVDDGSTDGSGELCDEYARKEARVRVLHKENGGLSSARNVGIPLATGGYITFVDSDDVLLPDALEYLYRLARETGANMSVCQRGLLSESGEPLPERGRRKDRLFCGNGRCMAGFFRAREFHGAVWGKLYRRWLFNALRFPEGKYCEDVFVAYLVAANCNVIAVGKEKKYLYSLRKDSIIRGEFSPRLCDAVMGGLSQLEFVEARYPKLARYAKAEVVRAADLCAMKLAETPKDAPYVRETILCLQTYYRRYAPQFLLWGRCGLRAKLFAAAAFFNLKGAVRAAGKLLKREARGDKKRLAPQ